MDAGEVRGDPRAGRARPAKFRVQMRVRSDLHQLIRLDSVASIQNDGLVGNKFVQIDSGTEASPSCRTRARSRAASRSTSPT